MVPFSTGVSILTLLEFLKKTPTNLEKVISFLPYLPTGLHFHKRDIRAATLSGRGSFSEKIRSKLL